MNGAEVVPTGFVDETTCVYVDQKAPPSSPNSWARARVGIGAQRGPNFTLGAERPPNFTLATEAGRATRRRAPDARLASHSSTQRSPGLTSVAGVRQGPEQISSYRDSNHDNWVDETTQSIVFVDVR